MDFGGTGYMVIPLLSHYNDKQKDVALLDADLIPFPGSDHQLQ